MHICHLIDPGRIHVLNQVGAFYVVFESLQAVRRLEWDSVSEACIKQKSEVFLFLFQRVRMVSSSTVIKSVKVFLDNLIELGFG